MSTGPVFVVGRGQGAGTEGSAGCMRRKAAVAAAGSRAAATASAVDGEEGGVRFFLLVDE